MIYTGGCDMFASQTIRLAVRTVWSIVGSVVILLSGVINGGDISCSPNAELINTDQFTLDESFLTSQGITTDGEYYYTAGSIAALDIVGMAKWTVDDFEKVIYTYNAIPKEIKEKYNSDHIGGISYYDGKIYAATEDATDTYNLILIYDAETLEFTGEYYDLGTEYLDDGIPYCAVDGENGYLYTSQFDDIDCILAYNLDDMSFSHEIMLSEPITRIQGAEYYDGLLYMSYDVEGSATEKIQTVDVKTGKVETLFERTVSGRDHEAEGLTVCPMEDGSFIHVADYDKIVSISIRHYSLVK